MQQLECIRAVATLGSLPHTLYLPGKPYNAFDSGTYFELALYVFMLSILPIARKHNVPSVFGDVWSPAAGDSAAGRVMFPVAHSLV